MNNINRISYCETCNNKGFNPKFGIVCGLTNERPLFEVSCEKYDENKIEYGEILANNIKSIQILKSLKNKNEVRISYKFPVFAFIAATLLPLLLLAFFIFAGIKKGFESEIFNMIILFSSLLMIISFTFSRFNIATVRDNQLVLKKIFGNEIVIDLFNIKDVSSFPLGRMKFIGCKIQVENEDEKSFIILDNSRTLFLNTNNTKNILLALKKYHKLRRFV